MRLNITGDRQQQENNGGPLQAGRTNYGQDTETEIQGLVAVTSFYVFHWQ